MRRKGRYLGIRILIFIVFCIGMLYPKMITFAGGINGNEARVIAAASGTFTYNGKTYRAGSAYINSLTSYLSSDDVDLTEEQANQAISTIYASVADGVEQGYLYEVGGENTTESNTTEDEKPDESDRQATVQEESTQEVSAEEESLTGEESVLQDENLDIWDVVSNPTVAKEQLEQRPAKENADISVDMEEEDIIIATADKEISRFSKTQQMIPDFVLHIIDGIAGILLAVTVLCGGILFAAKCMVFRKRKDGRARPGHSKRRKIRHNTRAILTIINAVSILASLLLLCIYVGLFSENSIIQNMQNSGYFRYAYSEYISGMEEELYPDFETGQKDDADLKGIVSYEDYLFTVKQNSLKVLEGETNVLIPDSNITPYIYNLKKSFIELFSVAGIFCIFNVILGILLMIFMDQRRERGIKHIAVATIMASVCMLILTIFMAINKPYLHLYIEPDWLYLFLMECIERCVMVMICVTAFSVVLGMILTGLYRGCAGNRNA